MQIHGPVAESDIETGAELMEAAAKFDTGRHPHGKKTIIKSEVVDFEHLNMGAFEYDDLTAEAPEDETAEERQERRARERKKILENRQRKEQHARNQKQRVRSEGEPYIDTITATVEGWYRFCVRASSGQVTAELDLRKESELGGTDEDGHVWTYREKALMEEEKLMEADTATMEGIKEEDFQASREKLKKLRRLLGEIQAKQTRERHRLAVHTATNEHSHSRMALNSLMETILFMAVTGYQVYTIRRWFKGAPVLGR